MDYKKHEEFMGLHIQMRQATDSLHTQAQEVYEMAKRWRSSPRTPLSSMPPLK